LLLPALVRTGHLDVAYEVLQQDTCPSWLYPVRAGATTIWERWDALRPDGSVPNEALGGGSGGGMVSFNHYAYGAVADWLHNTLAGLALDPSEAGYRHVLIAPKPGGRITSASASVESRYGHTAAAWRIDDGTFSLDVTVPPNATATVTLPDGSSTEMGSGTRSFSCRV
jgi:alpha-L-rhamnosidase